MFPVVHSGEVQKLLHITTDVFSLFPNHSNLYVYGGAKWNPSDTEGDKFINHARVEEAAVFTGFYKLKCGMNLAATHDYVRGVAFHFKACLNKLVLHRISIEKNQGFF